MTREFLAQSMHEIGEDYDRSLAEIHAMLDAVAQTTADDMGMKFIGSGLRSKDNGGVVYRPSVETDGGMQTAFVDLSDDRTLDVLNHGTAEQFADHIERVVTDQVRRAVLFSQWRAKQRDGATQQGPSHE